MGCLRILLERRILNHILFRRILYLFLMKSLRLFMGERLMVEKVGLSPFSHYLEVSISSEDIKELYSGVNFQTWNEKLFDSVKNIIQKQGLSTTSRSIAGNGQSLIPIRILVTFSMILIFQ